MGKVITFKKKGKTAELFKDEIVKSKQCYLFHFHCLYLYAHDIYVYIKIYIWFCMNYHHISANKSM